VCEPHTTPHHKINGLKFKVMNAFTKNTDLAPAFLIAVSLILAGCQAGDSDDVLTEPVTGDNTTEVDVDESEGSTEPFPFAEGLLFSPQLDCQELFDEAVANVLGSKPSFTELGADASGTIIQQVGVVGTLDDATSIFGTFDDLIGVGQCMLDSGTGIFGETVERENLTGLPEGAQGIRWETNYVNARTDSCEEYVERREFWLVQDDVTLYLTAAGWFGCSVKSEFPNEVSFDDIREQAADAYDALIAGL
jgi:hypothetical protein